MKMAEKSVMLTFQNNCEAINSNYVEVTNETDVKSTNNDITEIATNINKPGDEPEMVESTQEDAVEKLLAGESKSEFGEDLLLENIEADNDGIDFKGDNIIMDCPDLDKADFFEEDDGEEEKLEGDNMSPENSVDESLEAEASDCLTKMQIMEDVREGCSVQPSSPGHAEERLNNDDSKMSAEPEENGFEEESNHLEDKKDESEQKEEDKIGEMENGEMSKVENENLDANNVNEESSSNTSSEDSSNKRKLDPQDDVSKKLKLDIHENFLTRDKILNEFIEMAECGNVEQLHLQSEQILAEIRTLNELAKEKEREWNNVIHLKKMKEELLLRMQRRKQVLLLSEKNENGDLFSESQSDSVKSNQSILKANLASASRMLRMQSLAKQRSILPKPPQYSMQDVNGGVDFRNKQRPVLDVQSIIADYRQRHPEIVPRRALGSGAQVHQNLTPDVNSELGLLLNVMDQNRDSSRPSSAESSSHHEPSFKDMLVQFAKLSQSERNELIQNAIKPPPPPYPEVTVHPVPTSTTTAPTNSLLHGILTKSSAKANSKSSFSPTLARLLTAPERANANSPTTTTASALSSNLNNPGNMSISEILSTSKARNEITITPVGNQFETSHKGKTAAQEEEEAEDSADRLVIDESTEALDGRARGDNSSENGDEVPQCQGCNQKSALFVCAGCGNQWYCSRECQVSAWDEHSEVCSG